MRYVSILMAVFFMISILGGCDDGGVSASREKLDYSNKAYWSKLCDAPSKQIDVFFVHPTSYGPPANGKYNADINDAKLNGYTDEKVVDVITRAFADSCNIFAPRYRQVNIEVLSMEEDEKEPYFDIAIADAETALEYYLKKLNDGRPFILASHSQGSDVLLNILLRHPEWIDKSKLVAAYMPGWTFTDENIEKIGIPLSQAADETGVMVTWNTVGPGGTSPTLMAGARCVNPLSWKTDSKEYPASMHKGARILFADGKIGEIKNFTSAKIRPDGALEIPTPKETVMQKLNMSMGPQCYHRYDYDFFFYNVADNVKQRCNKYLKSQAKSRP